MLRSGPCLCILIKRVWALVALCCNWQLTGCSAWAHAQVTLGTEANTRADRFYQAKGWTRGEMKDAVEVFYTLQRPH